LQFNISAYTTLNELLAVFFIYLIKIGVWRNNKVLCDYKTFFEHMITFTVRRLREWWTE